MDFGLFDRVLSSSRRRFSRTLGDVALVQTVIDICKQNADKTIDEATTIAIAAVPNTEVKKQDKLK